MRRKVNIANKKCHPEQKSQFVAGVFSHNFQFRHQIVAKKITEQISDGFAALTDSV
jgi:hypothetical protein